MARNGWPGCYGWVRQGMFRQARLAGVGRSMVRSVRVRSGRAWQAGLGKVRYGLFRCGVARFGKVRQARSGTAW